MEGELFDANLAALGVEIPAADLARLDELTRPRLGFPFAFLDATAVNWQQAGATVNGVSSRPFSR